MPCDGRTHGNRCRLHIPGLTDHDNIRVLTEQRPKPCLKCQSCLVIYLHLIDLRKVLLHRVLYG